MAGTTYNIRIILATNARDTNRDLGDLGDRARGAGRGLGDAGESARGAGKDFATLGGLVREAAANFAGYLTAQAVFAGLQKAVSFAKDTILGFDDAMTQSLAIMGDVSDQTRKSMEGTARQVAVQYNAAVEEVAQSYYFLASAGYDAASSQQALGQVTAFAKAGMIDVERATELAADAQNAMGLKSDDAGENLKQLTRITDVLTKANIDANGSVEQFGEALTNKAAASARLAGISLEATVAVLEAFAAQGLKGLKAGEGFSIVLRELQTASVSNAEAFKNLGVTVYDAQGQFAGFPTIIGQIEKALQGQSVEQANATLATLGFTAEGGAYIKTLLGMSEEIAKYEEKLKSAGNATQQIAQKQMRSMTEQLKHLRSVAAELSLVGFEKLMVAVAWLSEHFGPAFGNAAQAIKEAAIGVRPLAEGLAKIAGGAVVAALLGISAALNATTGFLREHSGIVQALATVGLVLLTARLLQAGAAFVSMAADAAAFKLFDMAGGIDTLIARFTAARAAGMGFAGSLATMVGPAAIATGALAALGLIIYGVMTKLQDGERAAERFMEQMRLKHDISSLQGLNAALEDTRKKMEEVGRYGSTIGERLNIGKYVEMEGQLKKLNDQANELADTFKKRERVYWEVAQAIEATKPAAEQSAYSVQNLHDQLDRIASQEKIDPVAEGSAKKLADLATAANGATPAQQMLKEAFDTVASASSNAEDAIKAYETALAGLFGVHISAQQAENQFAGALDAVHQKVGAGVNLLDAYNARNREAREAVLSAADSALQHAVSVYQESGSLSQANNTLSAHREQLIQAMVQTGMSRAAAEQYIGTLKLTPENILTLARLNKDEAEAAARQYTGVVNEAARPRTGSIHLDVSQAIAAANSLEGKLRVVSNLMNQGNVGGAGYALGRTLAGNADGGVYLKAYARGGFENHIAQIAAPGTMRLWAEPETGGEAYIPLAPGKRQRSMEILNAVAQMFGYQLVRFAQGGMVGGASSGSSIVVAPGAVQVSVSNPASGVDVEAAVNRAMNDWTRNMRVELRTRRYASPTQV